MRSQILVTVALAISSGGLYAQTPNPQRQSRLLGRWVSTKFMGPEEQIPIQSMEMTFSNDSTFTAVAELKSGTKAFSGGRFTVEKGVIKMLIGDETKFTKFEWLDGQLVLREPDSGTLIWLRRVPK